MQDLRSKLILTTHALTYDLIVKLVIVTAYELVSATDTLVL